MSKCERCGKKAPSACTTTFYCSRQCQRKDWPKHKKMCHDASSHSPYFGPLGVAVKPPRDQKQCYLRISGDIGTSSSSSSTRSNNNSSKNKFQFSKDIVISRKRFIKLIKSLSHLYKYLNDITICNGPLMQEMHSNPHIQSELRHRACDICHATTTTSTTITATNTTTMCIFLNASNFYRYSDKQSLKLDGIFRTLFLRPLCVCSDREECMAAAAVKQRKNEKF